MTNNKLQQLSWIVAYTIVFVALLSFLAGLVGVVIYIVVHSSFKEWLPVVLIGAVLAIIFWAFNKVINGRNNA